MASCALALIGTAMADCAADLADLRAGVSGGGHGISKESSLAPLEAPDAAAGGGNTTSAADANSSSAETGGTANTSCASVADGDGDGDGEGIAKDGSLAPLQGTEGGGDTSVAMPAQDREAQQRGNETAAETAQAEASSSGDAHSALIIAAQAALDAGSEDPCSAVFQLIRTVQKPLPLWGHSKAYVAS